MNSTELTWQLVDPWTKSGWLILGGGVAVLTLLTLWTYWGVRGVGKKRLATVLALRLTALVIACLLLTRPGLAVRDTTPVPSKLLVLVDWSQSMSIRDGGDGKTRWETVRRVWRSDEVQKALERLQNEQQVELVYYQGADDVGKLNLDGEPKGKRTRVGLWLQRLREAHVKDGNLRGLVLFSDGIDNGGRDLAEKAANAFRDMNCPIYPYQVGKVGTSRDDRDVAVVAVKATPSPAAVKAPLTVRATIDVRGFDNPLVTVELIVEDKGKDKLIVTKETEKPIMLKPQSNEIVVGTIHPDQAGELKVTVRVKPLAGEANTFNNEMSTYVNVTKDGISVLWVEGKPRAWEPVFAIRHALMRDSRIRVTYTEPPPDGFGKGVDWYQFKQREEQGQQYDVIVIGDISAKQFTGGQEATIEQVRRLVTEKGVGLVMLGGQLTFANSDWQKDEYKKLADLLPVKLPTNVPQDLPPEQKRIAGPVTLTPTAQGKSSYLLRLDEKLKESEALWEKAMESLDGATALGTPRAGATVYATAATKEPLLVGSTVSGARVLAFGGDTTWKAWRRTPEAVAAHGRFWKQMILWLAKQEDSQGSLWIKPDTRRQVAGAQKRVGFQAGMRGKGGVELKGAELFAQVLGPDGKKIGEKKRLTLSGDGRRGLTPEIDEPGEYTIVMWGEGTDVDGKPLKGETQARFMAYTEDIEMATWAADDKLLEQLAQRSSGRMIEGEEQLVALLKTLGERAAGDDRTRVEKWPDWGQKPLSDAPPDQLSALWGSGTLMCIVVFTMLICAEWVLRRRWGLV